MEISKKTYYIIFLTLISVVLIILIYKWIHVLSSNHFIQFIKKSSFYESFNNSSTSHTVDLPLTTTYSCQNFCSPTSRCAITGQQCFTDIDCPGCQPYSPPLKKEKIEDTIPGADDAGKLTLGVTPQYSPLTSGYGTHEKKITKNFFSKPLLPNFGTNNWLAEFNVEQKLFNKTYKPSKLEYMPNYQKRYSLTGEFVEDGPLASNAPLI